MNGRFASQLRLDIVPNLVQIRAIFCASQVHLIGSALAIVFFFFQKRFSRHISGKEETRGKKEKKIKVEKRKKEREREKSIKTDRTRHNRPLLQHLLAPLPPQHQNRRLRQPKLINPPFFEMATSTNPFSLNKFGSLCSGSTTASPT